MKAVSVTTLYLEVPAGLCYLTTLIQAHMTACAPGTLRLPPRNRLDTPPDDVDQPACLFLYHPLKWEERKHTDTRRYMARRSKSAVSDYPVDVVENIVDIDVSAEMETSFLEYSYSVILFACPPRRSRRPQAVQRRILYMMQQMGLRPTKATSRAPA